MNYSEYTQSINSKKNVILDRNLYLSEVTYYTNISVEHEPEYKQLIYIDLESTEVTFSAATTTYYVVDKLQSKL